MLLNKRSGRVSSEAHKTDLSSELVFIYKSFQQPKMTPVVMYQLLINTNLYLAIHCFLCTSSQPYSSCTRGNMTIEGALQSKSDGEYTSAKCDGYCFVSKQLLLTSAGRTIPTILDSCQL